VAQLPLTPVSRHRIAEAFARDHRCPRLIAI
jgi:hypothetical protein